MMNGALVEWCHLELVDGVADGFGAVLGDHLGDEAAFDDELELGGAGVDVEGVDTAG